LGRAARRILITHGHWDHLGGVADLAEGTGAPVHMAEDERMLLEDINSFVRRGPAAAVHARRLLQGDETLELAGITFETLRVPRGTRLPTSRITPTAACSRATSSSPGRSGASTSRRRLGHARRVDPLLADRLSAGDDVYPGHGPPTTLGAELARNPFPRGAARVTRFEAPRGTHDILPSEQPLWQWVSGRWRRSAPLRLPPHRHPGIEDTELIVRTSGGGSDVVQKETYTFTDRGGRSLTLRPEATAPICRAYIQHGLHREPQPQKLYTIGPMWRYDRPQKGRLPRALAAVRRGDRDRRSGARRRGDPALRGAAARLASSVHARAELDRGSQLRPAYVERLPRGWTSTIRSSTRRRARSAPRRRCACSTSRASGAGALADAPKIGDSLCDACREHFERVRAFLDAYGVAYELAADARPRARLLHTHDLRVQDEASARKDTILRRGPLRRADRGDRRRATAGARVRVGVERLISGPERAS
jgi:hypothetical protein